MINIKIIELDNKRQYHILEDEVLGRGGYGTVKKAYDVTDKTKLYAVKIVEVDPKRQEAIKRQISVLEKLPLHPNLVTTKLFNCVSQKNYYIFMELCQTSLQEKMDLMEQQKGFSEDQILDMFYQLMAGYKILFQNKIVHQDIKPDNILIKKDSYKIADFGQALRYTEGEKYKKIEGTRNYIAPQKNQYNLSIDHKIDVYAFGVMFFILIIGKHPYMDQNAKSLKEYLQILNKEKLKLPEGYRSKFSLKYSRFFDLILYMIRKNPRERASFIDIQEYIQSNPLQKKEKVFKVEENQIDYTKMNFVVTAFSKVSIEVISQSAVFQKSEEINKIQESTKKINEYILSRRFLVFFIDRLARRLKVEQLKSINTSENVGRLILILMCFNRAIIDELVDQFQGNYFTFSQKEWEEFTKYSYENEALLKRIKLDREDLNESIADALFESKLSKIQQKQILNMLSNEFKKSFEYFDRIIKNVLKEKLELIDPKQKPRLVTLIFLFKLVRIVQNLPQTLTTYQSLESYYKQIEQESRKENMDKIIENSIRNQLVLNIDFSELEQLEN